MPGKVRPETHLLNRAWGKLRDIENWIALWNSAGDANGFEGEGYLEPEGAAQYATYLRQETDGVGVGACGLLAHLNLRETPTVKAAATRT